MNKQLRFRFDTILMIATALTWAGLLIALVVDVL
jgi:hypothetical protein